MLIIGLSGTDLAPNERDWLQHPAVSGAILFSRNFASRAQVSELVLACRQAAGRPILVTVDQEGGPVQRFRDGFTELPPLSLFGRRLPAERDTALEAAEQHAWLMASEMRAIDIDLSFAPVADLKRGNRAIGERAFDAEPHCVAAFVERYVRGMHDAGMAATLKHFPGHGSVLEDTHVDHASDPRTLAELENNDLIPFRAGIAAGAEAVMLAHVAYPAVDPAPAGYSKHWIDDILRRRLGFAGVAISDDIGMAAAESAGGVAARLNAHLEAGCNLVLVCAPALVEESLAALRDRVADPACVGRLAGRGRQAWDGLQASARYHEASRLLADPGIRIA